MFSKIKFFIFFVSVLPSIIACSPSNKINTTKLESNLGPYLYYYNGIQSRLYGDIPSAIELQQRSIKLDPSNSSPYYELALCYGTQQEFEKAVPFLEKAVEIDPNNRYYRHYLGILYLNSKQIDKALENQKYLVSMDSTNLNNRFSLALMYSDLGEYNKTLDLLNDLTTEYGYLPQVSDTKVKIYFENNQLDELKKELDKLINASPTTALYRMYQSEYYFRIGEDSLGFSSLNTAIELEPENTFIRINKYIKLKEVGNYKESLELLSYIFSDPNILPSEKTELLYPLLFDRSYYTQYLLDIDKLVSTLNQLHPNEIPVQELMFEHAINKKDFVTGRKILSKILELDNENPLVWERIITYDYTLGNTESAILYSQRAIRQFPQHTLFYILKAMALDNISETEMAIETLMDGINKVIDDKEGRSEIFGTIADLYYKSNSEKRAFEFYQKSLKENPLNTRILNNYSYYLSIKKQKLTKALEMSSKAVDLEPNNSTYIDTKGWVLFQMERYEEARDVLRNAISKSGSASAVINEHYADALYKSGNKESAYIYWIKAKELGAESEILQKKIETQTYIP